VRAWQVHHHGEPGEVLDLREVPELSPGPGEVVLAVRAAALNFADALLCRGIYQEQPDLPFTPGLEVVGVVSAIGSGAAAHVGQRVLAPTVLPHGGLADACLARASELLPLDEDVADEVGAALSVTYQTGWIGLVHRGRLKAGETLLVHAGAGGVGSAAIQLGVALGARVLATAGGPDKVGRCLAAGADAAFDHRTEDIAQRVLEHTGGRGVDVVYDSVGGAMFEASRRCVAFEGRVLVIGFASGEVPQIPANHVLVKNYDVIGLQWPAYRRQRPDLVRRTHDILLDLLRRGQIAPVVPDVRPLDDAAVALQSLASGTTTGKVVLRP